MWYWTLSGEGSREKLTGCVITADDLLYQAKKNGKDTYVIELTKGEEND